MVEFVAAKVGARTTTAAFTVDVSKVIPVVGGVSVNVLSPVPADAKNWDERRFNPSVVTIETELALADGWLALPVGEFTLVTIRA